MIDNLRQVNRLLVKLEESLPIVASMSPQLAATIREQATGASYIPRQCEVTAVHYLGDEGGIMPGSTCKARKARAACSPRSPISNSTRGSPSPPTSPPTRSTAPSACNAKRRNRGAHLP